MCVCQRAIWLARCVLPESSMPVTSHVVNVMLPSQAQVRHKTRHSMYGLIPEV